MSKVTIFLAPDKMLGRVFFGVDTVNLVKDYFHRYKECPPIEVEQTGKEAAEEAFDLTNNPSRDSERVIKYGQGRSVSAGDVIDVDGKKFICLSFGWHEMT